MFSLSIIPAEKSFQAFGNTKDVVSPQNSSRDANEKRPPPKKTGGGRAVF